MDIQQAPTGNDKPHHGEDGPVEPKLLSKEYDVANKILADTAEFADEEFTPEEDTKLRWKIDWHLIPMVWLFVSWIDHPCLTKAYA